MKKEELSALRQAILMEVEGYEFYKIASTQFEDGEVKKAFLNLMEEEKDHAQWLKEAFEKFRNHENDDFSLAFLQNPPAPGLFDWSKVSTKSASIPVAVFGIALEMEKASVDFYKTAKDKTESEKLKKLFLILETWETTHFEQFDKAYTLLKEDWWSDQGYAPF